MPTLLDPSLTKITIPTSVVSNIVDALKGDHDASVNGESAVWCVRHKESGKVYVGSSMHVHADLIEQCRSLMEGRHESRHLQHAWIKYGKDAFEFVVLYNTGAGDLKSAESDLIRSFNATDPKCGYNYAKRGV